MDVGIRYILVYTICIYVSIYYNYVDILLKAEQLRDYLGYGHGVARLVFDFS